jgi:mitochondrial fission protein ELM1
LFLVGGESKHYHWDDDGVLEQIQRVIETKPSVKQWIMTDSRRTPDAFRRLIDRLPKDRVSFYHNESTPAGWVQQQLERVDQVWVTPDSVSMVYEAITSGVPTGVFDLQPQKTGRIVLGIEELIKKGQLMTLLGNSEMMQENEPLCEADRAATWLLSRYKLGRDAG